VGPRQAPEKQGSRASRLEAFFPLALAVCTAIAYAPTFKNGFVHLDDPAQLTQNARVLSGVSWDTFLWSFTGESFAQPLTVLAYALLNSLFGLNPAVFHGASLLLHVANALLLFSFFKKATGDFLPSAAVASLFALHPVNVESVAWVAELNNVLSGTFFMLTLHAYLWYAQRPTPLAYLATASALILGLFSKQVLMTVPFLLLLLDLWPLRRVSIQRVGKKVRLEGVPATRLVAEKIPLVAVSMAVLATAIAGLESHNSFIGTSLVPVGLRVSNAVLSYFRYLEKLFIPAGLAPLYAYPRSIALWKAAAALAAILAASAYALREAGRRPYLAVGWFWFLGVMAPFLGLIQAGQWPEMAERYAYLTTIGVFVVLAWGAKEAAASRRSLGRVLVALALAAVTACAVLTWRQVGFFRDSRVLFERVVQVHPQNPMGHRNLGTELLQAGDIEAAIASYERAIALDPTFPVNHYNMGLALTMAGRLDEAIASYEKGIALDEAGGVPEGSPDLDYVQKNRVDFLSQAHNNLGYLLGARGRTEDAVRHLTRALELNPANARARSNLEKITGAALQ